MTKIIKFFLLIAFIQVLPLSVSANPEHAVEQSDAGASANSSQRSSASSIEARFLNGLRSLESGQPEAAIRIFSSILALDPTLIRVRLELARAFYASKQWDRARQEFFIALSGDLPEPVRLKVLGFIRSIDARRGFDWDLSFGLVNAGNSRNYDTDTILLDFAGVALPFELDRNTKSQVGLRTTGVATYRLPVGLAFSERYTPSFFAQGFFDITDAPGSTFDDYIVGSRAGLRFTAEKATYSVAPVLSRRYLSGEKYEDQAGIELAFEGRTETGFSMFGQASFLNIDNKIAGNLDGTLRRAQIGFRQSIGGLSTVGTSLFYEGKRVDFNLDNYDTFGVRLFGVIDIPFGITLKPSLSFEEKSFSDPSQLFTADPDEKTMGANIRIEKNDLFLGNGFSPFISLSHRRTKSGIDAFSYTETEYEFGLERRF